MFIRLIDQITSFFASHCMYIITCIILTEMTIQLDKLEKAAVIMKEGESVYDYQWYPLMNSRSPETCCLATTSQHQPIHLYDAFDGEIRATYR